VINLRIENTLLYNLILNNKGDSFKEGSVFRGKVVELFEETALIRIEDIGTIEAKLEKGIKLPENENTFFEVKSMSEEGVLLKPLSKEEINLNKQFSAENNPIEKMFKDLNIEINSETVNLVENLMKHNIPLNNENLINTLKTLEKLNELVNIDEGKRVLLADLPNIDLPIKDGFFQDNYLVKNLDIKYLLISDEKGITHERDVTSNVEEILKDVPIDIKDDAIKILSFFLKNGVKPSLNNIKNMKELDENPAKFFSGLKEVYNKVKFQKIIGKDNKVLRNVDDTRFQNMIAFKKENILQMHRAMENVIKDKHSNLDKELNLFSDKLTLLKELDNNLNFVFYPIFLGQEKDLENLITLMKEGKRRKHRNNRLNIFINLNTKNLGQIKTHVIAQGNSLDIKMYINEEDLNLFKSSEKKVIENVHLIGYSVKGINYIFNENFSLIHHLENNPNPSYILDLKA